MAEKTGVATTVQCPEQLVAGAVTTFQCVAIDPDGVLDPVDVRSWTRRGPGPGSRADGQRDRDCAHSANVSRPVACSGVRWWPWRNPLSGPGNGTVHTGRRRPRRREVRAHELGDGEHLRAAQVVGAAGRAGVDELDQAGRDLAHVDRLVAHARRRQRDRSARQVVEQRRDEVVELGRAQDRPRHAAVLDDLLDPVLRLVVARTGRGRRRRSRRRRGAGPRPRGRRAAAAPRRRGRRRACAGRSRSAPPRSTPATASAQPVAGEQVADRPLASAGAAGERSRRLSTRTGRPASRSVCTRARPRVPVPPVTRTGRTSSTMPDILAHAPGCRRARGGRRSPDRMGGPGCVGRPVAHERPGSASAVRVAASVSARPGTACTPAR